MSKNMTVLSFQASHHRLQGIAQSAAIALGVAPSSWAHSGHSHGQRPDENAPASQAAPAAPTLAPPTPVHPALEPAALTAETMEFTAMPPTEAATPFTAAVSGGGFGLMEGIFVLLMAFPFLLHLARWQIAR